MSNAPRARQIDRTALTGNDGIVIVGVNGCYARVQVVAKFTGNATITITNPKESITLDTQTGVGQCVLGYLIDTTAKDMYNVISSTVTPYSYRAIIEYHRTTQEEGA